MIKILFNKWVVLIVMCFINAIQLFAQVNIVNTNNPTVLAQKIVGSGVEITNATVLCNSNQSGTFTVTSSTLGMNEGIVLTTGYASVNLPATGVNGLQSSLATFNQGTGGDADLTILSGTATNDRCVLEFDFKADGDSIFFDYKFGSEEYPVFNCTNYNDVFGFFITGPGYPTPTNIALVPGTNIPVAINSVNNGVLSTGANIANCNNMGLGSPFTNLYINNTGSTTLTYDGFTKIFNAKAATQPCATYHLKLAIADGFDHIFDSGVFIKSGSLNSNTYYFTVQTDSVNANIPCVYEGCSPAQLKIHRKNFQSQVNIDTATVVITGTAANGIDYPILQTDYYFSNSVNDSIENIVISPFNDLITEGTETLKLVLKNKCGTQVDSITIEIKDPPKFSVFNSDTTICEGESVLINGVQDPGLNFNWNPTTGVSNSTLLNSILTPTATTSYVLTATYGNCVPIKDTVNVIVNPNPNITLTPTNIVCNGVNNGSILSTATGNAPITFLLGPTNTSLVGSPATFLNLAPGVYTITATSSVGCSQTSTTTIAEPTPLNWLNTTSQNVSCLSTNNGEIHTSASGGTGLLSYHLMPGNLTNTTGNFTSLSAGNYTIQATDANGCSQMTSITVNQTTGLNWNLFSKTNASCNGNPIGTVTANASGGIGMITYTLNPGTISNTTGNFTNLAPGTYTVTATDAITCFATSAVVITPTILLNISSSTITNPLCNGATTGSITITAAGGTPTYLFTLNPGSIINTSGIFNNLIAGVYTVTVMDANNCTNTSSVTITQPSPIVISNPTKVNPTCNQPNIGSIVINASGGSPSLSYKLNALAYQTSNSFTNLSSGTYTITVKDANGCTKTSLVSLSITNTPILTNSTLANTCLSNVDTIIVLASNGLAPYTYSLQPGNLSNNIGTFPNISTGIYTVSVIDANGCTNSLVLSLEPPPGLSWANLKATNIPCSGVGLGSLNCLAALGTPPYTYQLSPTNITNTTGIFNNLPLNSYTITASDILGCTTSSIVNISVSPPLNFNTVVKTDILCSGSNTGSMTLTASGGSGFNLYTLLPNNINSATGIFSALTAGTYTVKVADASNCSATTIVQITEPSMVVFSSINSVIPTCSPGSDGKLIINAIGGIPPYTYQLNAGFSQTNNTFSGLNNGNYIVTIKDANNCTKTSLYNLANPNLPSVTSVNVNQVTCAGNNNGSITTIVAGGTAPINYTINPGGLNNTTGIFDSLPINNYIVSIVDANNCTAATVATIQQTSVLTWNTPSITQVSCNGLANGKIVQTATGGNGVITYVRTPGNISNTTGTFIGLLPNTYTITATDANGCSKTTTALITQPLPFNWNTFSKTNAPCFNTASGIINASAVGGTSPVTFFVNPGNISNTTGLFNTLLANTYTVIATDANGCSVSSTTTITQPSTAFNFTQIQNTIPTCNPGNNATITTAVTGGVPNYLYSINGGLNQTSPVFVGIGVSTYTIKVTDAAGCSITSSLVVSNPSSPIISNVVSNNVLCYGNNTGNMVVTASGGTGTLTYNLNPGNSMNSTGVYNNLGINNYTVIVADANNCSATTNITISQPPIFKWDSVNKRDVPCFGGFGGLVTSSASGGAGGVIYTLLPNNTSNTIGTFLNLGIGQYTLIAVDSNGCQLTSNFTINQSPQIIWSNPSVVNPICFGDSTGTIQVTASGGAGNFIYKIQPINITNTTGTFTNLAAGIYTITAKDANSCTITTAITINAPPQIILSNAITNNATCNPGCDGSVVLSTSGGNGIYTYSINNATFQSSNQFTNLCAGVYTVFIKDSNHCKASGIFSITTVTGPNQITANNTNVSCYGGNNGSTIISSIGGTGVMTYQILPTSIANTNGTFLNLVAGNYTISATDVNGCTIQTTVVITQPPLLQFNSLTIDSAKCFNVANGSIIAPVSGGTMPINYSILPTGTFVAPNSFTNLLGNITYTITAIDAKLCSTSTTVYVGQPNAITITTLQNTPVTCNGQSNGTITISSTGGTSPISYQLLPGNIFSTTGNFTNLLGNNYTIIATDANGCSKTSTTTLFEPSAITITNSTSNNIVCFGQTNGSVSINAIGGIAPLSYHLMPMNMNNANGNFSSLSANIYTVTITDANGCTQTNTQTIIEPTFVDFIAITPSNVLCNGGNSGSITALASGGVGTISYLLNPVATLNTTGQFNNLPINTYTVIASDANGCSKSSTITITEPLKLNLFLDSSKNVTCFGGNDGFIRTHASGGTLNYLYTIQPTNINSSSGIYSNLFANNYTLFVVDGNGCVDSVQNIQIIQPTEIMFTSVTHQDIECYKDSSGSISVVANGGTGIINYRLDLPTNPSTTTGNFINLPAATYTVIATDSRGCTKTTNVTIKANLQIVINLQINQPICFGDDNGEIILNNTGGVAPILFSMNGGAFTSANQFINLSAGSYLFTIKDSNNCTVDTTIILTEPEKVGAEIVVSEIKCNSLNDGKIKVKGLGGRGQFTYYIKPSFNINKHGVFSDLEAGNYTLTVKDSAGCDFDTLVTILPPANPFTIEFTKEDIGCLGLGNDGWAIATPVGGKAPYTYVWSTNPAQTKQEATQLKYGRYTLQVLDANGCEIKDSVYINPGPCCDNVFVPNAFSPNGDGRNDEFRIVTAAGFQLTQLDVYDRWGNKVWSTLDARKGWDGKYKGVDMDVNTYFYIFRYDCFATGEKMIKKGDVQLIR